MCLASGHVTGNIQLIPLLDAASTCCCCCCCCCWWWWWTLSLSRYYDVEKWLLRCDLLISVKTLSHICQGRVSPADVNYTASTAVVCVWRRERKKTQKWKTTDHTGRTGKAPSCHLLERTQLIAWTVVILSAWRRLTIPCMPMEQSGGIAVALNPSVPLHRNGKWYVHSMEMQNGADSLTLTLTLNLNKP